MEREYIEIRYDIEHGWVAFRRSTGGTISGHYKAYDGQTYHNTPLLGESSDLPHLLVRAFGTGNVTDDVLQESLAAIKELQNIATRKSPKEVTHVTYGDIWKDKKTGELVEILPPGPPGCLLFLDNSGKVCNIFPPSFFEDFEIFLEVKDRPGYQASCLMRPKTQSLWSRLRAAWKKPKQFGPWTGGMETIDGEIRVANPVKIPQQKEDK
jgi:hypothetical protein